MLFDEQALFRSSMALSRTYNSTPAVITPATPTPPATHTQPGGCPPELALLGQALGSLEYLSRERVITKPGGEAMRTVAMADSATRARFTKLWPSAVRTTS